MRFRTPAVLTIALAALLCAAPALAEAGAILIQGGSLSIEAANINFTTVTLDGARHDNGAGTTSVWTAIDPTGTGAGWHLTIAATNFTNAGGKTISKDGFTMQLLDSAISVLDGNAKPTSSLTTHTSIGTLQTFASAAVNAGMGSYTLLPTFALDVPASTFAGSYNSTVTVSIVSGP